MTRLNNSVKIFPPSLNGKLPAHLNNGIDFFKGKTEQGKNCPARLFEQTEIRVPPAAAGANPK